MSAAPSNAKTDSNHRWRFFRAGGVDQVRLDTGDDIARLEELDQKLWVALSCPVKGLEFDERTLALIDSDKDGRVRAPEILGAVRWTLARLKSADDLTRTNDSLPLAAIDDSKPEGRQLLSSVKQILAGLGKGDAKEIAVADTMETTRVFKQMKFNGDGVLPPSSVDDAAAKAVAADIIACLGGEMDRSTEPGITQAKIDPFFAEAQAFSDWWAKAEKEAAKILPIGDQTVPALEALNAVKVKIDDYFARCRLAAYDPRATTAVNRQEAEYLVIAAKDMTITAQEVAGFPLSQIEAGKPLPLKERLNPAWSEAIGRLADKTVAPLLGKNKTTLGEEEWLKLKAAFAGYESWLASKVGVTVEKLGLHRVREILAGKSKEVLTRLVAEDKALEVEMNSIASVEKLARLHRDLHVLLNNFVSFADFYSRRRKAIFQAGTMYLDSRSCELCFKVDGADMHAGLAVLSRSYLAYCDCTRPSTGERMTIAVAFTAGDSDHLIVGRNGVFYDRKGRDFDATIVRIIDNPISIGQAFWAPYKRVLRFIEEQVAKRAAAADEASTTRLTSAATAMGDATKTGQPPAKPKFDIGIVAALGVAVGGLATAFSGMMNAFFGLKGWMPVGFLALILAISGPSMLIAWLKLRQRNLGPILDANGWAVNGRVKINLPLGSVMTDTAKLPPGSERSLKDPYAQKRPIWPKVVIILLILGAALFGLYKTGYLKKWYQEIKARIEGKTTTADPTTPAATTPEGTPPAPSEQQK